MGFVCGPPKKYSERREELDNMKERLISERSLDLSPPWSLGPTDSPLVSLD